MNIYVRLRCELEDLGLENVVDGANRGDVRCLMILAWAHFAGYDVSGDRRKAIELASRAAEGGSGEAEFLLGSLIEDIGQSGPNWMEGRKEACKWYKRAADHGCSDGMLLMSIHHGWGYGGVPVSESEALRSSRPGWIGAATPRVYRPFSAPPNRVAELQQLPHPGAAGQGYRTGPNPASNAEGEEMHSRIMPIS